MSGCTINSVGLLSNEINTPNPHEYAEYRYQVTYTETDTYCSHVSWSLIGDVPVGLSIDSDTGLISGIVERLDLQPTVTDLTPIERMRIDGSNYDKIGRPIGNTYTLHFTIVREYMVQGISLTCDDAVPETATSDVSITIVKDHTIDTVVYAVKYLEAKESTVSVNGNYVVKKHTFLKDGAVYDHTNIDEYLKLL